MAMVKCSMKQFCMLPVFSTAWFGGRHFVAAVVVVVVDLSSVLLPLFLSLSVALLSPFAWPEFHGEGEN